MEGTVTLSTALAEILPVANSAGNVQMSDVIGNKNDTIAGDSLAALLKQTLAALELIEDHNHAMSRCYPTLADSILVTGGAGAWELGNAVQVVPINTILAKFDIHWIMVSVVSSNDIYELVLYSDAACTIEVGRARSYKLSNQTAASDISFMTPIIAANSGIWAKLASKTGGNDLTISLFYHTY